MPSARSRFWCPTAPPGARRPRRRECYTASLWFAEGGGRVAQQLGGRHQSSTVNGISSRSRRSGAALLHDLGSVRLSNLEGPATFGDTLRTLCHLQGSLLDTLRSDGVC